MRDDCVLKLRNYPIIKAAFFIYLLFWWFVPTFALHGAGHGDALPCNYPCADFHSWRHERFLPGATGLPVMGTRLLHHWLVSGELGWCLEWRPAVRPARSRHQQTLSDPLAGTGTLHTLEVSQDLFSRGGSTGAVQGPNLAGGMAAQQHCCCSHALIKTPRASLPAPRHGRSTP